MASLQILNKDGSFARKIDSFGVIQGLDFGNLKMDGRILSWEERFLSGTYRLRSKTPEIITYGNAKIYLHVGFMQGHTNVLSVRIESHNPAELAAAIEMTILYIGGKVSTKSTGPKLGLWMRLDHFYWRKREQFIEWRNVMRTPM